MKTLFLHVGHGKTGTSYLQSTFARSMAPLRSHGIIYPEDPSTTPAAEGRITSGNGFQLLELLGAAERGAADALPDAGADTTSVMFSSEFLFGFLIDGRNPMAGAYPWDCSWKSVPPEGRLDRLVNWARLQGFQQIKVLLLIRNPISRSISGYQQDVKRRGCAVSVEEACATTFRPGPATPQRVLAFLTLLDHRPEIVLTVRNYSVVRQRLLSVAADWLEVPLESLNPPPCPTVNRSMTAAELELQRCLNRVLGPSGDLLSDPLCDKLPNILPEIIYPSAEAQAAFWEWAWPDIEAVNERIDPQDHYCFDGGENPPMTNGFSFSGEQLGVIAESMGTAIKRLREEVQRLESTVAVGEAALRECASQLQTAEEKLGALNSGLP